MSKENNKKLIASLIAFVFVSFSLLTGFYLGKYISGSKDIIDSKYIRKEYFGELKYTDNENENVDIKLFLRFMADGTYHGFYVNSEGIEGTYEIIDDKLITKTCLNLNTCTKESDYMIKERAISSDRNNIIWDEIDGHKLELGKIFED